MLSSELKRTNFPQGKQPAYPTAATGCVELTVLSLLVLIFKGHLYYYIPRAVAFRNAVI
jgi:hypothetical protein